MLRGKRTDKLAFEIKQVVAEAMLLKIRDPRIGFVTVTEVKLSPDLRDATIYISVMGDEKQKKSATIALSYARGFFQKQLGDELSLKFTPRVHFRLDESLDEAMRINTLLKKISDDAPAKEPEEAEEELPEKTED